MRGRFVAKVTPRICPRVSSSQRRAKHAVATCIRRTKSNHHQQQDDSDGMPLVDLLQQELRHCIGEVHWSRAQKCYHVYCAKQGLLVLQQQQQRRIIDDDDDDYTQATQVQAV